jgi:hypothetical protein
MAALAGASGCRVDCWYRFEVSDGIGEVFIVDVIERVRRHGEQRVPVPSNAVPDGADVVGV